MAIEQCGAEFPKTFANVGLICEREVDHEGAHEADAAAGSATWTVEGRNVNVQRLMVN